MNMRRTAAATLIASSLAWAPATALEALPARPGGSAPAASEDGCGPGPLPVIAAVLHLAPDQAQQLAVLVQVRQAALAPIAQQIALRQQRIRELIAAGGDPTEIGTLLLQVHQLESAAATVQAQFLAAFAALLDEGQRRQWEQVRLAGRLQPVLPAFQALQLL